jgi:fatty acid amide hydrolase
MANSGAQVEEWTPPDMSEAWVDYLGILFADGSASARRMARGSRLTPAVRKVFAAGRFPRGVLSGIATPILRGLGQHHLAQTMRAMGRISADQYWQLLDRRAAFCERFEEELDRHRFEVIICPPDAVPALRHDTRWYLAFSYAAIWNLLDMPAGVVAATRVRPDEESDRAPGSDVVEREARRCEQESAGLPVGVQVVARQGREDVVLRVMKILEVHFRTSPDYPVLQRTAAHTA